MAGGEELADIPGRGRGVDAERHRQHRLVDEQPIKCDRLERIRDRVTDLDLGEPGHHEEVTGQQLVGLDAFEAVERHQVDELAAHRRRRVPAFVLARIWENPPAGLREAVARVDYVPWLVANLTLDALPADLGPAGLAWDNVLYGSASLGYIVATHQSIRVHPGATVITWYRPLTKGSPRDARKRLSTTSWRTWVDEIVGELARPHPGLPGLLKRIDIWRWGHAMPRPVPGFLGSPLRSLLAGLGRPLSFAHSDLRGLSLFEEAHDAGVRAARRLQV